MAGANIKGMAPYPACGIINARCGFTLTELISVMAIVGMLAAMAMSVFSTAMESANSLDCRNKVRQLTQAANLYAQDNRGLLAPCRIWRGAAADGQTRNWCDESMIGGFIMPFDGTRRTPLYRCRSDRREKTPYNQFDASLGINSGVVGEIYDPSDWTSARKPLPIMAYRDPDLKVEFTDDTDLWIYLSSGTYTDPIGQVRAIPADVSYTADFRGSAVSRHKGALNMGFLSGRVASTQGINIDSLRGAIQLTRSR